MPRQFTKALDLYKHQMGRFRMMNAGMRQMHEQVARSGYQDSQELTSGGVSSKQLRAMGHPFGRNRGFTNGTYRPGRKRGALRSLPINRQTGGLRARLKLSRTSGGIQSFKLSPGMHPGNWVLNPDGTRRMIGRGFHSEIKRRWRPRNKALLDTMKRRQSTY